MASTREETKIQNVHLGMEQHKKRKKGELDSDTATDDRDGFVVGMVLVEAENGVFGDPHAVGKFVRKKVGDVLSVRITRKGLVVIQCKTKQQQDTAMSIKCYNRCTVRCFELDGVARSKGVVGGVPLSFSADSFLCVSNVCGVQRLKRSVDGIKEDSTSLCLTFRGKLPEKIFLDYVCYRVRPFELAPLRCFACQEYGHVAAVCRGERRCANCGKNDCEFEECRALRDEQPTCCHCGGTHRVGSADCPRRKVEGRINVLRRTEEITYAAAVKRFEGLGATGTVEKEKELVTLDKKNFLAFIAMVVNCSVGLQKKSERINLVLDAARMFLDVDGITGEDLDSTLREGYAQATRQDTA